MRCTSRALTALAVLVLLTGCEAPSPFASAAAARIDFARSGGLAGGEGWAMTIASDGAYTLRRRGADEAARVGRLPEPMVARLQALVARVPWDAVERNYAEPAAADAYTYTLAVTAAGSGDTVVTAVTDASLPNTPDPLAALITYLGELMQRLAPAG